jgi:deoxyribodipyrimidine photo-lyase
MIAEIGNYPAPIVNIEETRRYASDIVWVSVKKDEVKEEEEKNIEKHVSNPNKKTKKHF